MKKALKIGSLTVVVLIAALLITPFFFKDKITQVVKIEINNMLNAKVDFGDVGLSLFKNFPNFTFSIDDLSVVGIEDFENDTLMFAKTISLTLDLGSVLSGNYEVSSILLDQPAINVIVLKSEKANYDIMKASDTVDSVEVEDSVASAPFQLKLKSVEIRNAQIGYDDRFGEMYSRIEGFSMLLGGDMTASTANLELTSSIDALTFEMEQIAYLKKVKITFDAGIAADLDAFKFDFKDNSLVMNGLKLNFDGYVAMPSSDIDMDLTFSAPEADFKSLMSLIPAFYMEGFESIRTDGKVSVSGHAKGVYGEYTMPAFAINIEVENGKFQYPDLPKSVEDIQIVTHINSPSSDMNDMVIDVSKFHFSMAKNPVDITLKLKTPLTDPNIDVSFMGKMNLASVAEVYPLDDGVNLKGVFTADVKVKGKQSSLDLGRYQDFEASGAITINGFDYKDNDFPDGVQINKAILAFTPRFIDLAELNATYNKNTVEANGKIYDYMAYAFSDGVLKASFNLSSDFLNIDDLMASSSEEVVEQVAQNEEVPMEAFDVPDNIDFSLQCIVSRIKYDNININTVFGKITMANEQVQLDNLNMELFGGKLTMNGYYNSSSLDSPMVNMMMEMKQFDMKNTYESIDMVQQLAPIMRYATGTYSCFMTFKGKLNHAMEPNLNSVNANGVLSTSAVKIQGAKSIDELANSLKINELKEITTKPMEINFAISDGKLMVKPIETTINGMPFTAAGVTYLNQNIDYDLSLSVPTVKLGSGANSVINSLVGKANSLGGNITVSDQINVKAKMTGTTSKPVIALDLKQSKDEVKNTVKEEINNAADDLKKQAQEEADRIKKEMEEKARQELAKQQEELERKKKEAEERAKKKLEEEAKKLLKGWKK